MILNIKKKLIQLFWPKIWILIEKLYPSVVYFLKILSTFIINKDKYWTCSVWDQPTQLVIKKYGWKYIKLFSKEKRIWNKPKSIEKKIHQNLIHFSKEKTYNTYVYMIPWWRILWKHTPITQDKKILWDCTEYPHKNLNCTIYKHKFFLWKCNNLKKNIWIISWNGSDNYFHRMIFGISKYYLLKKSQFKINKFVVDYNKPFHKEAIKILWINRNMIIKANDQINIKANNIIIANNPSIYGNIEKWHIDFLRETFLIDKYIYQYGKKIIIKRPIDKRCLTNHDDIYNFLKTLWFIEIVLENLSVCEQAKIFHESDIIISPHWAWLTNLVFCREKTKVIEIFHTNCVAGHFYCISNNCKLDYYYMIWEEEKNTDIVIKHDRNIIVPIKKFKDTLSYAWVI